MQRRQLRRQGQEEGGADDGAVEEDLSVHLAAVLAQHHQQHGEGDEKAQGQKVEGIQLTQHELAHEIRGAAGQHQDRQQLFRLLFAHHVPTPFLDNRFNTVYTLRKATV